MSSPGPPGPTFYRSGSSPAPPGPTFHKSGSSTGPPGTMILRRGSHPKSHDLQDPVLTGSSGSYVSYNISSAGSMLVGLGLHRGSHIFYGSTSLPGPPGPMFGGTGYSPGPSDPTFYRAGASLRFTGSHDQLRQESGSADKLS